MPPAPAPLSVRVLGGGRDIGRSCLLLTLGDRRVLLDCGAHPAFADARRFPDLAALPPLDAVLVTHFHLDHAGALPLLRRLQRDAAPAGPVGGVVTPPSFPPVVMTRPTRALTQLMLRDFYDTSAARRQALPFSDADVRDALDCVAEIELDAPYSPPGAPDLRVSAFYAGHVLGAVMFRVAVRGVGCVVYSGDYTTSPDALLRAADVPVPAEPVDLFITEATYCSTIRKAPRSAAESELVSVVVRALHARGKVLIPVSALGRAHELIAVLSPLWNGEDDDLDLSHVPVYVAAGLMSKAAAIYDVHAVDWCCGTAQDPHKLRMPQLREFKRGRDWAHVVEDGPMLMFATPGNLSTGVSLDIFRAWCGEARNVVVVPGFCFSNTLAARLLAGGGGRGGGRDGVDGIGEIRCRLLNMSLGAHADARGIVRTVRRLSPRAVMLVHGEDSKVAGFEPRLRKALGSGVQVFAPANGDTVDLRKEDLRGTKRRRLAAKPLAAAREAGDVDGGEVGDEKIGPAEAADAGGRAPGAGRAGRELDAFVEEHVDAPWRALIEQYKRGPGVRARRVLEAGRAQRPVDDGVSVMSRLYADLLPDVARVDGCATDLRYKECVSVTLERGAGVVRLEWEERVSAVEAAVVLYALDAAASPPGSPEKAGGAGEDA
jgi:integrator complex subunit 11